MTDIEKEFKNLVRDIRFDDKPDYNHRENLERNLLAALNKQFQHKPQVLKIWKIIMRSKMTHCAAAVMIIFVIIIKHIPIYKN